MKKPRMLNGREADTLVHGLRIEGKDPEAGIFPKGSNQTKRYESLAKRGYLLFAGMGRDAEGRPEDPDVRLYVLTDAGRNLARSLAGLELR